MAAPPKPKLRTVRGQPSWRIASDVVEAFVTELGGHVAPVTFERRTRRIMPYSIAPWVEERTSPKEPPIIKVLRGDFFCMPFGGNSTAFGKEKHPVHGETANARWHFESLKTQDGKTSLHLSLDTRVRKAHVDKIISLADGQNNIYSRHVISKASGPMNLGHHAMLKFPDEPGSGAISTSRFVFGQVFPRTFEQPELGGYSFLKPGAEFDSLDAVPAMNGGTADLSRYPARRGFEDLVLMVADPSAPFAWTAVTFPKQRYVWFALKDPNVLRQTVMWISNGGRHYPPWSSRHVNVLGLEEVTSFFHIGLAESAGKNALSEKGFPTTVTLRPDSPLAVSYIMGVASIPPGFNRVSRIEAGEGQIILHSAGGKQATAAVDLDFLRPRA
ncbi:MAG TPA: hypothetical protein VH619_12340 [Verrucomicrobiae bacterium]|jgi:hypothetical protein|nr:hypothetical protein [Verrucomicrobiae bacterium]